MFKETVQRLSEEVARLERAKPTLRESEEKYKKLVEDSLTCIYSGQK